MHVQRELIIRTVNKIMKLQTHTVKEINQQQLFVSRTTLIANSKRCDGHYWQ